MEDQEKMNNEDLSDYFNDLVEEKYSISNPEKHVTNEVIELLIKRIVHETLMNSEIQFQLLESLYKWSWFPCEESYYLPLVKSLELINHPANLIVALKIISNSGKKKDLEILKKYLKSPNKNVRETVEIIFDIKKDSYS